MLASEQQRTASPSPSRRISFGTKISALGAKLTRTISGNAYSDKDKDSEYDYEKEETDSVSEVLYKKDNERSTSRGRDAFQSTGRGGLGNIRQTSLSRDARPSTGPDDFSITRGREPIANPNQFFSTGRGGAGNLRSPSREPSGGRPSVDPKEEEVIREYMAAHEGAVHSSGRGGIGNMNRSRSRDPGLSSPGQQPRFSTGRGGAGNIVPGDPASNVAEALDEDERRRVESAREKEGGYRSSGRGGAANLTTAAQPSIEQPPRRTGEYESTGRGGAGNIVKEAD